MVVAYAAADWLLLHTVVHWCNDSELKVYFSIAFQSIKEIVIKRMAQYWLQCRC